MAIQQLAWLCPHKDTPLPVSLWDLCCLLFWETQLKNSQGLLCCSLAHTAGPLSQGLTHWICLCKPFLRKLTSPSLCLQTQWQLERGLMEAGEMIPLSWTPGHRDSIQLASPFPSHQLLCFHSCFCKQELFHRGESRADVSPLLFTNSQVEGAKLGNFAWEGLSFHPSWDQEPGYPALARKGNIWEHVFLKKCRWTYTHSFSDCWKLQLFPEWARFLGSLLFGDIKAWINNSFNKLVRIKSLPRGAEK